MAALNTSRSCSSIRPSCGRISTRPERQKKRRTTGPRSGPSFATTGGLSTKLHAACTDERTGVSFVLSGGERNDAVGFEPVWQGLPETLSGLVAAVMDKAYDSDAIRHYLGAQEIEAVIPPRSNRTEAIGYDKEKYERREKVERSFNKLKQFRRIATRYEKLGRTFMAFIHIVSTWIMLR